MLAYVKTPSGATCKGVLQLKATFIEVKNMYPHQESNPGLWNTIPMLWPLSYKDTSHDEEHAFHINVPSNGYTSIPYTPLYLKTIKRPNRENREPDVAK